MLSHTQRLELDMTPSTLSIRSTAWICHPIPTVVCPMLLPQLDSGRSILLSQGIDTSLVIDELEHIPILMPIRIALIEYIFGSDVGRILLDCSIRELAFINERIQQGFFIEVSNDFFIVIHRLSYNLGQCVLLPTRIPLNAPPWCHQKIAEEGSVCQLHLPDQLQVL